MTVVDDGLVMARILQEDYLEAISLCQEKGCREFNKTQVKTRKRKKKIERYVGNRERTLAKK